MAIAYDAKSVTVFLVWHAAVIEPACLRLNCDLKPATIVASEAVAKTEHVQF